MANRPFKIPKDTKGNEYFPVTTTDAIIYSDNGEKKVLTEVIKKDLEDLSSLIIDEENRVLKEDERKAAEISRTTEEDIRKQNEEDRKANELTRQNSFSSNEAARQKTFNDNESARQNTFIKAESQRETAETIRQEEELKRQEAETIRQENYDKKVDRTDNAPELTSGFAGNLVGRGEATSEEIDFRPSGGLTSVNDGAARIERLKGNTVVWNQLAREISSNKWSASQATLSFDGNVATFTATAKYGGFYQNSMTSAYGGHKYYRRVWIKSAVATTEVAVQTRSQNGSVENTQFISASTDWQKVENIISYTDTIGVRPYILDYRTENWSAVSVKDCIFIDLTQMFGAGNEPTTIEEFNARKPLGIDEYAYNEGELISTTADEIKSVGFNAWDEERASGYFDSVGTWRDDQIVSSKNPIPLLEGEKYYCSNASKSPLYATFWESYAESGKTSSGVVGTRTEISNRVFTIPLGAKYMHFNCGAAYGPTYNNDICIHLVHTGYRNGEYEPYEEFRRSLPISEIKDSEGNALFPNGLLSAGSVYDEITATKAIKRIGMVDMGSLTWYYDSNLKRFNAVISNVLSTNAWAAQLVCPIASSYGPVESNKIPNFKMGLYLTRIYIRCDLYDLEENPAAAFKAAMSGVMLYYELAGPIEVDLEEPLNLDYEVSDFGTEEVISDTPTTPLKADIIYQFNAVDRIRENSLSLEDLIKRVAALEAQNAALVQQLNATDNGETE